jgi:hypothetical protein
VALYDLITEADPSTTLTASLLLFTLGSHKSFSASSRYLSADLCNLSPCFGLFPVSVLSRSLKLLLVFASTVISGLSVFENDDRASKLCLLFGKAGGGGSVFPYIGSTFVTPQFQNGHTCTGAAVPTSRYGTRTALVCATQLYNRTVRQNGTASRLQYSGNDISTCDTRTCSSMFVPPSRIRLSRAPRLPASVPLQTDLRQG